MFQFFAFGPMVANRRSGSLLLLCCENGFLLGMESEDILLELEGLA